MACAGAPCSVATSATAAGKVAGLQSGTGMLQHAGGRIADQHAIALADGDEVLRLGPQARQQRLAFGWPDARPPAPRARPAGNARRSAASVGGAASANRASAGGAPGRSPSFWPAASASGWPACTSGDPASGLLARGEAAFVRVQPAGPGRPALAPAGGSPVRRACASSGARFGGCRCSSAARRLSSGARSGAGAAAPPCGGGRCSRAVTRAVSGPRSGDLRRRALLQSGHAGFQRAELARQGIGLLGSGRRNGGMPPDPDQPGRQDQEAGGGQPGKQEVPPRRRRGRRRWRLGCRVRRRRSVGSLIAAARASRPGSAERRRGSAARGAPVMPRRRAGR